jgi:hypothetical protein
VDELSNNQPDRLLNELRSGYAVSVAVVLRGLEGGFAPASLGGRRTPPRNLAQISAALEWHARWTWEANSTRKRRLR